MQAGQGFCPSRPPTQPGLQDKNTKHPRPGPPAPIPSRPGHHGAALTCDIELDGPLHDHTTCGELHLTGEVGAVVLGLWGEGEH